MEKTASMFIDEYLILIENKNEIVLNELIVEEKYRNFWGLDVLESETCGRKLKEKLFATISEELIQKEKFEKGVIFRRGI